MIKLIKGTIKSPAIIAIAPALIGDFINPKNIFATVSPTPVINPAHTPARVTPFQYKPYKNGAKNAPANAPHEMPISCAIKVGGSSAITTETTIKNTIKTCIVTICFFSLIFFIILSFKRSSVSVELDVSTREERVDIDAESTSTTTTPISRSGSMESICGIILS